MFAPWLEQPGAAAVLAQFSERAGLDLARLGTSASADEIKDTAVTQPLVVSAALLAARGLELPEATVVAGHSVGELAAAAVANVWSPGMQSVWPRPAAPPWARPAHSSPPAWPR